MIRLRRVRSALSVVPLLASVVLSGSFEIADAALVRAVLNHSPEAVAASFSSDSSPRANQGFHVESGSLPQNIRFFVIPEGHRVEAVRTRVLQTLPFEKIANDMVVSAASAAPVARVVGHAAWMGWQIVSIAVSPLQRDGAQWNLATQVEVELETQQSGERPRRRGRRNDLLQQRNLQDVQRYVANPADAASFAPQPGKAVPQGGGFAPASYPDLVGSDVSYLIITPASLQTNFQVLADWKTRRGIPTVVRSIEEIVAYTRQGSDLQETLRNYLQDAYANWSLEYVLLGGDTDHIPARYVSSSFALATPEEIPCDLYFSGLDGSWNADGDGVWGESGLSSGAVDIDQADLLSEVSLSRATVLTPADVDLFVSKVIGYETPLDASYQDKPLFLAEVIFPADYNGSQSITTDGAQLSDDLINVYLPQGTPVRRRYETSAEYPGSLPLDLSSSLAELDTGYNLVNHMGHGFRYNMSVGNGSIGNGDAEVLQNGNRFSVVNVLNCTSLAFDFSCLAEHYLSNPSGGAVAVLGASRSAYPLPSREYQNEFYDLLFNQGETKLGRLFTMSRLPQTPQAGYETAHRWTHYIYNVLGDPEMQVFCALPQAIQVTHDVSANLGDNSLTITVTDTLAVPLAQAQVCLLKGEDDYQVGMTDGSGSLTLPFRAESAGTIAVTVSGRNLQTYLGTITVAAGAAPYVHFEGMVLDDDSVSGTVGNGDAVIDAGETIDMTLTFRNDGVSQADTLTGTVSVSDPYVSVVAPAFTIFNVAPGGSASAASAVRLHVLPAAPDNHVFEMIFTSTDGTNNYEDRVGQSVHAPVLEVVGLQVLDQGLGNGNGIPEEGETFDLVVQVKNFGSGAADGINAILQSTKSFIFQVLQASGSYGSIGSFASGENSNHFRVFANFVDDTVVNLRLTDAFGRLLILPLDLVRPTAPAGAPSLDPSTSPSIVLLTWPPVSAGDLRGYHVYRATAPNGPWSRVTIDPTPVSYFRDTGLASSTKYWYYTTSLDQAGNESTASASAAVSTNPPQMSGWPIAMQQETSSSPALGDLDGDGKLEVVQGNLKIYAWHAENGQEIVDADGDAQTWGVFLDESGTTTASVALGELDGSAGLEVISCNWDNNMVFATDGDGTLLWSVHPNNGGVPGYWGTPTISDVDRDGYNEIFVVSKDGRLYAWNNDGTPLLPGNPDGTFAMTAAWSRSSPAIGDLDGDIDLEIVVTDVLGRLHAWDPDGTPLPNFPLSWGFAFFNSPVLGDVDNDGDLEIVAFSESGSNNLHVLHGDGTELNGWPKTVTSKSPAISPTPALADLDNDGKLEIIVGSNQVIKSTSSLHVYHWDGTAMSGWPQITGSDTESSPVVADLDGDASPDIMLGGQNGVLRAWSSAGSELVGFPLSVGDFIRATPAIADVDGDGDVDVVFSGWDRSVYVWDLPAPWDPALAFWPTFLHDASRTARSGASVDDITDVAPGDHLAAPPRALLLAQNHPNPFNPTTTIEFGVPGTSVLPAQLSFFDVRGRQVRLLLDKPLSPGHYRVLWDGRDDAGTALPSGVYFYRLQWQGEAITRRLVLMK